MNINAAILWEQGAPLSVEAAELGGPRAGEVLVKLKAAGVCHSDLHPARGSRGASASSRSTRAPGPSASRASSARPTV